VEYSFVRLVGGEIAPWLAGKLAEWYDPEVSCGRHRVCCGSCTFHVLALYEWIVTLCPVCANTPE
jgi:hypothetical protein